MYYPANRACKGKEVSTVKLMNFMCNYVEKFTVSFGSFGRVRFVGVLENVLYLQIMEIFCRLGEYFVDDGNILQIMGIICRLWKYFADYGNTFQILGHRGGATLLGFDAMWLSCSALVLFIIIIISIIVFLISIIVLIIVN